MYHDPVLLGLHSRLFPASQVVGIFAVHPFPDDLKVIVLSIVYTKISR